MSKTWVEKKEREAGEKLRKLLDKPMARTGDEIGIFDPNTDETEYFDPWDLFPELYGSYSSEFDDVALTVLRNISEPDYDKRKKENIAHEMFREMLCTKYLCDYGTSPRGCFGTKEFKKSLPELIDKWEQYYKLVWGEDD